MSTNSSFQIGNLQGQVTALSDQIGSWSSTWTLLGTAEVNAAYTVTADLTNYKEFLLMICGQSSILATTIYPNKSTFSGYAIQARYKTDSNENRDAYFNMSSKSLSCVGTAGTHTARLYAR